MNWKRIALLSFTLIAIAMGTSAFAQSDDGQSRVPSQTQAQAYPLGYLLPWPPDLDYQAFLDQSSQDLFGKIGMALTTSDEVTAAQVNYPGTALFQESGGSVSTQPFTLSLGSIESVENDTYTDPSSGVVVDVQTTWIYGTVMTANGSVDAYIGAITADHPSGLTEHYLVLLEPDGGRAARSTREPGATSTDATSIEGEEEDPCDSCIADHNKKRNKAVKRHKRCRRKALLFGGGATIIASFGGPWGTAGGLLGTAAAVDACNDTLKDAKEDAVEEFCDCWAENDCDEGDSNYQDNCT